MADPFLLGSLALGGTLVNQGLNRSNMDYQAQVSKELMDYQWNHFNSPKAQVAAMTAAGLNPAAMFDGGKGSFASPSVSMPSSMPVSFDPAGTLSSLSQYILAKAQAKKAGVEISNLDVERQTKEFELELSKFFSAPAKVAEITLAWKNVMLANDEHNIKEWQKVKEEALAGLTGIQKEAAEKELANMDTVIEQQNKQRSEDIKLTQEKQKTEGTQQSANRAAARASNSQADVNEEEKRLRRALADIEESGSTFKLESLLRKYERDNAINDADKKEAHLKLQRLKDLEGKRDSSLFSEIDSMLEWLKNKVSIFH